MEILNCRISDSLNQLYLDVINLNPEQQINFEIADGLVSAFAEAHYDRENKNTIIKISKEYFNEFFMKEIMSPQIEVIIAHEILHAWCRRKGFPNAFTFGITSDELTSFSVTAIADLPQHNIIKKRLKECNFNLESISEKYIKDIYNWPEIDPPEVINHIKQALKIADYFFIIELSDEDVEYLSQKYKNTMNTAMKIAAIIKDNNPLTPDSCRRCMVKMTRLLSELLGATNFQYLIGLDLVLSRRQLDSNASLLINHRRFLNDYIQYYFILDGFFFTGGKYPEQKYIDMIDEELNSLTAGQFLDKYKITYGIREV